MRALRVGAPDLSVEDPQHSRSQVQALFVLAYWRRVAVRYRAEIPDHTTSSQHWRLHAGQGDTGPSESWLKGEGSPYSITERKVPELIIPVLGSQPAGQVSHKPGGGLPLLSARPAVTPATLKRAATNFAAW